MQPPICARCKKNVAVVFITKMENGKTVNEGLCLKCAKELNIRPVEDLMQKMGISDEDLDGISEEMTEALSGVDHIPDADGGDDESGKTATFPFFNKLFWARPSAMAVLPTPGSPMRQGLFFCRRFRIWITRSSSVSRPTIRSSFPSRARPVRSWQ